MTEPMGFSKIVVAYDGSKDAAKAVDAGSTLAAKFGAELIVVHVYSSPSLAYGGVSGMPTLNYGDLEAAAKEGAMKVLEQGVHAAVEMGVKARGELLESTSTVEALVEFSATEKADLIVVGTRGMTGFKKLLLGSVSSGLVSHAHCPVLVMR